jgi:uncharacterized membrane protein
VFLMFVSAVPFAAALLSQYYDQPIAIAFYCGNLITAGLVLYGQLRYAAGPGRLFDEGVDPEFIRAGGRRTLMGPVLYTVALVIAFVNTGVSLTICALVPLLYILPGRVDMFWRPSKRQAAQTEDRLP